MDEHSENINKEGPNIRKYQTEVSELTDTISELKNTLNNKQDEAEGKDHWIWSMNHIHISESLKGSSEYSLRVSWDNIK